MAKDLETLLKHYGVKGMKWGVRNDKGHEGERAKTKDIAKADKKYEKSFSGSSGFIKMHNEMASQMNKRLDGLNSKYEGENLLDENSPRTKSYLKEYENLVKQSTEAAMKEFGTNASGTGRVKLTKVGSGADTWFQAEWEDLKHADGSPRVKIKPKFNNKGFIISQEIEFERSEMKQSYDCDEFLAHYGVKGMQWGKRKSVKETGVSRMAGAVIDRNAREIETIRKARDGEGNIINRGAYKLGTKMIGKEQWDKNFAQTKQYREEQNQRYLTGKQTVNDKMEALMTISMVDLYVSIRPKAKK